MSFLRILACTAILAFWQQPSSWASSFFALVDPSPYLGMVVGNGHCVTFIQAITGAPRTSEWRQGIRVRGNDLPRGTAIATFRNGVYPGSSTGNHAALYDGQDEGGIWVWDQWRGQPIHRRYIRFMAGSVKPSNDGDAYYVIEHGSEP